MRAAVLIAAMLVLVAGCRKTNGAYCGAELGGIREIPEPGSWCDRVGFDDDGGADA